MTSEARPDEYEALWRKALIRRTMTLAVPETHEAADQAATAILRDHVEAKLAEVRATDQHFIDQCELKAHNATVALAEVRAQLKDARHVMAKQSATIAEQAAEIERLRYHLKEAIPSVEWQSKADSDSDLRKILIRKAKAARAALGGSHE